MKLREFAEERNWNQFHNPKNLAMALGGEIGELLDIFQWLKDEESSKDGISDNNLAKTKEELADIFLYLVRIADKLDIDLIQSHSMLDQKIHSGSSYDKQQNQY